MNLRRIINGVKERLPEGEIYNKQKKLGNEEFLRLYHKYYRDIFFKGARNIKIGDYMMEKEYFEFANLSFPAPKTVYDFKILMHEAHDLLFPYKYANNTYDFAKIEKYFDEGPYELNRNVSLKEGDIVINCGANMGLFSNIALAKSCEVYAFEPSKSMRSRYLNKYNNRKLHIEEYALSDHTDEEIEFLEVENHEGSSCLAGIDQEGAGYVNGQMEEDNRCAIRYKVNTITLDDWVEKNNISKIDFIKADIEGAERCMLRGGVKTIHDFCPKISICTYHFSDDPIVLENIIHKANPNYVIEHKYKKLYAYVPQR